MKEKNDRYKRIKNLYFNYNQDSEKDLSFY